MLPFLDRPYMGSFSRPRYSPVSLGMTARCFSVNILSVAMWEFVRVLLEVYSTEVREYVQFYFVVELNGSVVLS